MWLRVILARPLGVALARFKKYNLRYTGEERAPHKGPFIVVTNHQTGVDVIAEGIALRKVLTRSRMIPWGKKEIKRGKEGLFARILWYYFGVIPIDRNATDEAPKAIKKSLNHLRRGKIIFVHPEGARFPHGQLGPFKYGVANLARAVPCPVLPVGVYRRLDSDGGIQVNIGTPFFMPDLEPVFPGQENTPENIFRRQVEMLKKWCEGLDRDRKSMKLMVKMIGVVTYSIDRLEQKITMDRLFRMADPNDSEYLRDKVLEMLPDGWKKVDSADWGENPPLKKPR
ncbi:MAG: hypothetical protein CVT63_05110 [Candidatus Anoxymicrobium japonicum]|uniref:Phospholipid/glycerol acyltransferase domain-containing protein n=1 Tax=Candidatus Anoxymicrobium japonicum TaxID=2013648 RepID=A0A2N3G5I6_9ACTN|nr:MAG: hypothetical protein CVT63_05110 [Candidatus Anoxymicrobium japonicum]